MVYTLKYNLPRTGDWTFQFNSYLTIIQSFPFKIKSLGDFEHGYEDEDENTIFPTEFEMTITDRDWLIFDRFNFLKSFYKKGTTNPAKQFDLDALNLKIYKPNGQLYGFYIVDALNRNIKENTVTITFSSGIDLLGKIRIDNPYFIRALEATGNLESEPLRNTAGTIFPGAWAYGAISSFRNQTFLEGFLIRPSQNGSYNTIDISVVNNNSLLYDLRNTNEADKEKKLGKVSIIEFIEQGLKLLNADMEFSVHHNWKFGEHEKSITDLYAYDVYKGLFGRVVIFTKGVWDSLGNGSDASKFYYGQAAFDKFEKCFEDDTYIAFKLNVNESNNTAYWTGANDRMLLTHLKAFAKNFYSQIFFESLHKASVFKKGYANITVRNQAQIKEYEDDTQTNKIRYVKINYRNRNAERGVNDYATSSDERLEYEVYFSGKFHDGASLQLQGFGGLNGTGSTVILDFVSMGNLFYYFEEDGEAVRQLGIKVKDEDFGEFDNLIDLLAEIEYLLRKNDRDLPTVTMKGIDNPFTTIYKLYYKEKQLENKSYMFSEFLFKYAYPLKMSVSIVNYETKFNMIQTLINDQTDNAY